MTSLDELSDSQLMLAAQQGRRECFAQLVRRYQSRLVRVAESRLGRRDWAEDAVQETLLAAYRSRKTFQLEKNFRTWLWTILLNQCRRQYKRRTRRREVAALWGAGDVDPRDSATPSRPVEPQSLLPSPLSALLAKERAAQLDAFLAQLTPPQADALRLRFFAGLKFLEIAETMECSLLTAKNRVRYGLARMAQLVATADKSSGGDSESPSKVDIKQDAAGDSVRRASSQLEPAASKDDIDDDVDATRRIDPQRGTAR